MNLRNLIITLSVLGCSARKMAREIGLNRKTVASYLRLKADPAKPTTRKLFRPIP